MSTISSESVFSDLDVTFQTGTKKPTAATADFQYFAVNLGRSFPYISKFGNINFCWTAILFPKLFKLSSNNY